MIVAGRRARLRDTPHMTATPAIGSDALGAVREQVDRVLARVARPQRRRPRPHRRARADAGATRSAGSCAAGGKRLRPAFCIWGYRAAVAPGGAVARRGAHRAVGRRHRAAPHDGARARRPHGCRDPAPRGGGVGAAPRRSGARALAAGRPRSLRSRGGPARGRPRGRARRPAVPHERMRCRPRSCEPSCPYHEMRLEMAAGPAARRRRARVASPTPPAVPPD